MECITCDTSVEMQQTITPPVLYIPVPEHGYVYITSNPLTPELNPFAQRCLMRFCTGDFASWTVHFVNICVKNQQLQLLFIQFINYVW
jgi:hypothetical protein